MKKLQLGLNKFGWTDRQTDYKVVGALTINKTDPFKKIDTKREKDLKYNVNSTH